jgi:hypothetical protein
MIANKKMLRPNYKPEPLVDRLDTAVFLDLPLPKA